MMNRAEWCVVKFALENSVEAVPTNWLQDNQCYWPNYNEKNIQQSIINREEPVKGEWKLHEVKFFRNNVFDNYDLAQKKARKATYTSDLESEAGLPTKRRITLKRYSSISSEEEVVSVLPPPPALRKGHKRLSQNIQIEQSTSIVDNEKDTNQNQGSSCPQVLQQNVNQQILPREQTNDTNANELLTKVVRKLNIHSGLLANILEKLDSIEHHISNKLSSATLDAEAESIFPKFDFPINMIKVLDEVEDYLSDKNKFLKAVHELYRLGGTTPYDFVARCLTKLITNRTASQFSYYGRRNKRPFQKLQINRLVLNAGLSLFKDNHELDFEKSVARWLKRANERKDH